MKVEIHLGCTGHRGMERAGKDLLCGGGMPVSHTDVINPKESREGNVIRVDFGTRFGTRLAKSGFPKWGRG